LNILILDLYVQSIEKLFSLIGHRKTAYLLYAIVLQFLTLLCHRC
jgi:hypothetical protein